MSVHKHHPWLAIVRHHNLVVEVIMLVIMLAALWTVILWAH